VAEVKGFILKLNGFHLDGQVIDSETIMKFSAQLFQ